MKAFVKSFAEFKNYAELDITKYDAALDSIFDEQSVFTAKGRANIEAGDFLICRNFIGYIFTRGPGENINTTDVVCNSILDFWSRRLVYPGDGETVEAFIASELTANFKSIADAQYDMPYLNITHSAVTPFIQPDIEDGLYDLKSYIAKVRRVCKVFVTFSFLGDVLNIDIAPAAPPSHNIIFGDGHHQIISEEISKTSVAKITTKQGAVVKDWYLNTDGTITNVAPLIRVEGAWITLPLGDSDNDAEKVADEFAKNSKSHKIQFRSANVYGFFNPVTLRIKGTVLTSYISGIRVQGPGDPRYLYTTGELQTTLTDKLLKELI